MGDAEIVPSPVEATEGWRATAERVCPRPALAITSHKREGAHRNSTHLVALSLHGASWPTAATHTSTFSKGVRQAGRAHVVEANTWNVGSTNVLNAGAALVATSAHWGDVARLLAVAKDPDLGLDAPAHSGFRSLVTDLIATALVHHVHEVGRLHLRLAEATAASVAHEELGADFGTASELADHVRQLVEVAPLIGVHGHAGDVEEHILPRNIHVLRLDATLHKGHLLTPAQA